jgi:hypothetical protein
MIDQKSKESSRFEYIIRRTALFFGNGIICMVCFSIRDFSMVLNHTSVDFNIVSQLPPIAKSHYATAAVNMNNYEVNQSLQSLEAGCITELAEKYKPAYKAGDPFRHVVIDELFPPSRSNAKSKKTKYLLMGVLKEANAIEVYNKVSKEGFVMKHKWVLILAFCFEVCNRQQSLNF